MSKITEKAIAVREKTTPTDLALIKRTVAPGATDDQLALFLYDCERRGVNPLDRLLIFTNAGGKYTPITTIDFMRSRAVDSGEMAGSANPIFTIETGKPVSASVTVYRLTKGEKYEYSATARFTEYYRNTPTWNKMPFTMIAKCAEALALRKAFPAELRGLYVREEMDQARTEEEIETTITQLQILETRLNEAAEKGVGALREVWQKLSHDEQLPLKSMLDNRFKPRAIQVDAEASGKAGEVAPDIPKGGSGEDQSASGELPPHDTAENPVAMQVDPSAANPAEQRAYDRGYEDRTRGIKRSAVPGEYRENSRLGFAWIRGWEDRVPKGKG